MSNLEKDFPSTSLSMSSDEVDTCVEQCFNFIHKSKNFSARASGTSGEEAVVEGFLDSLTDEEVERLRKKMFSYWETTKTRHLHATVPKAAIRSQDSEPTTQTEEAVISFEDAKSDTIAVQQVVRCYNLEQLIDVELKDIRNSKLSKHKPLCTTQKSSSEIESMDFTELKKKAADLPGTEGIEKARRQEAIPNIKSTDTLEVLLQVYEYSNVDSTEKAEVNLSISEIEDGSLNPRKEMKDFQLFLVNEMKIIYNRLASIYPLVKLRVPENVYNSNSSSDNSNNKNSSSPKIAAGAVQSSCVEGYPDLTADSSSASGWLNEPVLDMLAAQPTSKSSGGESGNTTSSSISEDNTLSGVSSIPTDPRASVSSLRDLDQMASPFCLDARTSLDVYPRTSVSSMRDPNNRTSFGVESLGPMSPRFQQAMLEDYSDDAFLTAPLEANTSPGTQNPRRRGLSSKHDEDKSDKVKKPAL